jgi:hypothetical protein
MMSHHEAHSETSYFKNIVQTFADEQSLVEYTVRGIGGFDTRGSRVDLRGVVVAKKSLTWDSIFGFKSLELPIRIMKKLTHS